MKVISICNQKGGVGKTTTTIELAACLSRAGKKVIAIDLDQQGNMSMYLKLNRDKDIYGIMEAKYDVIEDAIQKTDMFDAIASNERLSKADIEFSDFQSAFILQDIMGYLNNSYDIALIDTSPSRNVLLNMAYIASDYIIVPTECDTGSLAGISAIEKDISLLRDNEDEKRQLSHALIMGIVLTKYENTNMHKLAIEMLNDMIENEIKGTPFIETIRKTIKASETKVYCESSQSYEKNGKLARDYRNVANKILEVIR